MWLRRGAAVRCGPEPISVRRTGIAQAGGDRGMVTVEAAIALAAFMCVVVFALAAVVAVLDQVRCVDAAREAARMTARGDRSRAAEAVERIAPDGARLSVSVRGDEITVHVSAEPAGGVIPGVDVDARAFAIAEPGVNGGGA